MTKKEKRRIQLGVQKRELEKGLRSLPKRRLRRVITDEQREERRIRSEQTRLDRLMERIRFREMHNDYAETVQAIEAKQASEAPGRFGRGESALDQYVTHDLIQIDRDYHGCRRLNDPDDDGDTDAWARAD